MCETVISTSLDSETTHWGQAIQFLDAGIPVCEGDRQAVMARLGLQGISHFLPAGEKKTKIEPKVFGFAISAFG
jgi:hypothetical protein